MRANADSVRPSVNDFAAVGRIKATAKGLNFVFSPKMIQAIRGVVDSFDSVNDKQTCIVAAAIYIAVAVCSNGNGVLEADEDEIVAFATENQALLVSIVGHALKGTPKHKVLALEMFNIITSALTSKAGFECRLSYVA